LCSSFKDNATIINLEGENMQRLQNAHSICRKGSESTATGIHSNRDSQKSNYTLITLNSIYSVDLFPLFWRLKAWWGKFLNSCIYILKNSSIICAHLIIMTWLFSKTRWIISWEAEYFNNIMFSLWQKKKETTWAQLASLQGKMEAPFFWLRNTVWFSCQFVFFFIKN